MQPVNTNTFPINPVIDFDIHPGTGGQSRFAAPGGQGKYTDSYSQQKIPRNDFIREPILTQPYSEFAPGAKKFIRPEDLVHLSAQDRQNDWNKPLHPPPKPSVYPKPEATSSFDWPGNTNAGGKGVGDIVPANPNISSSLQQPIKNLINYQPASSLLQGAGNRPGQPYVYGDLGLTTSDYSIWGSKGNPYITGGPGYNPGRRWGTPILPQPIVPISPTQGGDDSPVPDWVDPADGDSSNGFRDPFNDTPFNAKAFGQLYPGLGLAAGLAHGRVDFGDEYFRLPWYEGAAGGGYGYTEEGYDQYAPGDIDRGIYSSYYDADGNLVTERDWDDSFDAHNTDDRWAQTGLWEGLGNWLGGRTWDGLEEPAIFSDPNSDLAKEATRLQIEEKAEKAANRQAIADAEQAKLDAEQARWDEQYAQINNLNTEQISLMNDIKSDMQDQYGTFQDEILSQVSAENASMFESFAEYKEWMGEKFTTQQSGLDEALAVAAATNEGLNSMQIDLMNTIAEDMQNQYGAFSAEILSQVSAENASMFDSFAEYKQWMGEEFTTLESGLNEQLAQQAAINEGLNSNQIDLMNSIAEDMQNQYGAFSAEILSQVSAENAALFDSLEEYQQWMADDADTAPATIADAVEAGKPFGQEGDDTWSPDGHNIYHGPGHNWNTPDSENTASPGTVTPPPAPTDPFGGGMDDLDWGSGGDDGGDDFDSNEEASDNYDDFGGDWGDWD